MTTRSIRWTLLLAAVASFAVTMPVAAGLDYCGSFTVCPNNGPTVVLRKPYSSIDWSMFTKPVGDSVRIAFTNDEAKRMVSDVMWNVRMLNTAMPSDRPVWIADGGDPDFQWGWVPQSNLRSDPNEGEFAPAAMGLDYTNCWITTSIGKFAYDAGAGISTRQWVADYDYPPSYRNGYQPGQQLQFFDLATHEYGHAMGLKHYNSNSQSTMYPNATSSGTPADTMMRTWLACEANRLGKTYEQNPARLVDGFMVVVMPDGVHATWDAINQTMGSTYQITAASTWDGQFRTVMNVAVHSAGHYDVVLPLESQDKVIKLFEVGADEVTIPQGADVLNDYQPPPPALSVAEVLSKADSINASIVNLAKARIALNGVVQMSRYKHVIFVADSMRAGPDFKADYLNNYESTPCEVVTTEEIGGDQNIPQAIRTHLPNGGTYELVGDLNDSLSVDNQWFRNNPVRYTPESGYSYDTTPLDPKRGIIRGWFAPETISADIGLGVVAPYTWRDGQYSNFTPKTPNVFGIGDSIYGGGREPASNNAEALLLTWKSILNRHPNPRAPVDFFSYVHDFGGVFGDVCASFVDTAKTGFPNYTTINDVRDTPSAPLSPLQRDQKFSQRLNAGALFVGMLSTGSGRGDPAAYANVNRGWDPDTLMSNQNQLPVIIGASCLVNGLHLTYQSYGSPASKQLVLAYNRGALIVIGPSNGTDLAADYRGFQYIKHEWLTRAGLPFGIVFASARCKWVHDFPADSVTAASFNYVGDPSIVIPFPAPEVVGVGNSGFDGVRFTTWPNPVMRTANIAFALPVPTDVSLKVYDVAGRHVATLMSGRKPAGIQTIRWNPDRMSGVYFLELRAGMETRNEKIIVLH